MADLIGALIAAVVESIAATVQLCVQIVAMVLESLGFAVGHLAEKPKESESRFSAKRLMIAFAPLAIVATFLTGTFVYFDWKSNVRRARQRETKGLIEENVERLVGNVDKDGRLIRRPAALLDVYDAWGNKLRVEYDESLLHQAVTVRSDGADKMANTIDDLSSTRRILRPKIDFAKGAIDKAGDAVRARLEEDKGEITDF